jgi:hypothetical protein
MPHGFARVRQSARPDSEIRYVLANKTVFRLKEELGTDPKFWYYTD